MHYELATTDSVSDVGVRFDSKLSFMDHINDKVNKAYGILGIIIHLDISSFVLLYKAMVRSHLEYTNSVWCPYKNFGNIEIIEKVKRATTLIISLKKLSY